MALGQFVFLHEYTLFFDPRYLIWVGIRIIVIVKNTYSET